MREMKTFSAKSVDEAMEEACRFFGVPREKLEIEIVSGGSSGIFGLVGKKKAEIRARRREDIVLTTGPERKKAPTPATEIAKTAEKDEPCPAPDKTPAAGMAPTEAERADEDRAAPVEQTAETPAGASLNEAAERQAGQDKSQAPRQGRPPQGQRSGRDDSGRPPRAERQPRPPRPPRQDRPVAQSANGGQDDSEQVERQRPAPAPVSEEPVSPELEAAVREVLGRILNAILETEPEIEISGHAERVVALIRDEANSGLLIGREGQTLAALQYMVNRIVARRFDFPVRIQINTGEYRERQDDNLRKMAIYLADRAKTSGRPQSTKPLSSYHRRVVHLALQEDETVQTRSKGEGPLKRVLILPKAQTGEGQARR